MNKSNDKPREMLITKGSLRTTCTRSKTPSVKELPESQVVEHIDTTPNERHNEKLLLKKPRCRRQWIEWSGEEKRCFYEGLAEYGKDYGKIQGFMNKKLKLKSDSDGKTKEQIRFFYHRTWSKISKSLNLQHEEDSKKSCRREIHYLLCLGELRKKKSVGFGAKVMKQLDELVRKGFTYIRLNGRNLRIRPPNRYLKRLYRDVSDRPDITLPKSVTIEFLPNSNVSFNFVQQHAFNPRLRFTGVNINAKFSEVFDMINKRFTDVHESSKLDLYIYPLQSDLECSKFAKILSNAESMLESLEKTQDLDIVLERSKDDKISTNQNTADTTSHAKESDKEEVDNSNIESIFPKIFGQLTEAQNKPNENCDREKNFPGYWTYPGSQHILLRTLYVAFDQNPVLKFKYEWKKTNAGRATSFATHSMSLLVDMCENTQKKFMSNGELETNEQITLVPTNIYAHPKTVVPGIIRTNNNDIVTTSKFALPFRPRPGRKRTVTKQIPKSSNNSIAVYGKAQNSFFKNAVAVNLIPQPAQFVQFAPPGSVKLVNKSPAKSKKSRLQNEDVVEVIEEGFQEHFQSLTNIITTSNLNNHSKSAENNNSKTRYQIQRTPIKLSPAAKVVPASPNLEWLNGESVDISLTSFLNVCETQGSHLSHLIDSTQLNGNSIHIANGDFKRNDQSDPVLPTFHSGDTSQGPLSGLAFELSNSGVPTKSNHFIT